MRTMIFFLAVLFLVTSCSYYRVIPKASYNEQTIMELQRTGKILILHRGEDAWLVKDISNEDSMLLAKIDFQLGYHVNYLDPELDNLNQFDKRDNPDVVNSVHLYTSDTTFSVLDTMVSIPISSVYNVNTYEYAKAPSRASLIVPLIFFPVAGIAIFALVAISNMEFDISGDTDWKVK